MNEAVRIAHCFGAILTGITIVVLAIAISVTHGSAFGAAFGFLSLVAGYGVGVNVTGNQNPVFTITAALVSWASALASVVLALLAL
ncbi:hypothetical protein Lo5R7ANS_27 [Mesorhizobium phage vB_MloP_Lo5R7ANS]|uniref:Uncharacterized protein n=1 Tax=Mesorhizobium phage vB_MloP_Lo5R7ANS TaxID=1527771 RepID=A0A076YL43_9CAUD|nr:hypothetical protein Lo5R7ANS_27 [Mesorhizobium phage vB_MloP_Lo5R7ANS]AIK68497.1 hypothetical protein Lo5R7ANS_27 [Mesorhizobium phage vB_MloP_Lo5R7ANS]